MRCSPSPFLISCVGKALAIGLFSLVTVNSAQAQTVYVTTSDEEFGTFDLATNTFTSIGDMGERLFGVAIALDGTFYGVGNNSILYTINPTTAEITAVGDTDIGTAYGLAFRTDSTLFTMNLDSNLYVLDTANAAATLIGPIGNSSSGTVEFSAEGDLLQTDTSGLTDSLVLVNQSTGAGTPIGDIGFSQIYGLTEAMGTLYGFDSSNRIITIDKTTGAGTLFDTYTLPNGGYIDDATIAIALRGNVPEPGSLTLFAGAGLVGLMLRRKRRN